MSAEELDDTARLILMEMVDVGDRSLIRFHHRLGVEGVDPLTVTLSGALWAKYMGYDGRSLPTHDLWTGRRY